MGNLLDTNQMRLPNSQDVYGYNKDALFGQFGMDPKGNNESGAWARRNQQLVGSGLTDANSFALNTLEPARQGNLASILAYLSQGNEQARTQRNSQAMANQGKAQGDQSANAATARGFSPEYAEAIRALLTGNAQRSANQYVAGEGERVAQNSMNLGQILQQSQQNPFLQQFMALAQLIEGRHQQNQSEKSQGGLGGILGSLGQIASSIPFPGPQPKPEQPWWLGF
jgi:hypothetical protein